MNTNHVTSPTVAAYDPDTMRNVPKYFTPMAAFEILIEKPTKHISIPARIKGERIFSLSDAVANTTSVITALETALQLTLQELCHLVTHTSTDIWWDSKQLADNGIVPKSVRNKEHKHSRSFIPQYTYPLIIDLSGEHVNHPYKLGNTSHSRKEEGDTIHCGKIAQVDIEA